MLKTKPIYGTDLPDLTQSLNEALSHFTSNKPQIQFLNDKTAVIIYEEEETYVNRLCCECIYWDDTITDSTLVGFCQNPNCGGCRKRFSDKACKEYRDIRS